jgi:ABC-type dipeptide/oligopeptide/nickel transport system permease subunit
MFCVKCWLYRTLIDNLGMILTSLLLAIPVGVVALVVLSLLQVFEYPKKLFLQHERIVCELLSLAIINLLIN